MPSTCQFDGCSNFVTTLTGHDKLTCEAHTCSFPNCVGSVCSLKKKSIPNSVATLSKSCQFHACAMEGCPHPVIEIRRANTCQAHTCRFPNCLNIVYSENMLACREHVCEFSGCTKAKSEWSNRACLDHQCQRNLCWNNYMGQPQSVKCSRMICKKSATTCEDHTCHKDRCDTPIDSGEYCSKHKCLMDKCKKEKFKGIYEGCWSHTCRHCSKVCLKDEFKLCRVHACALFPKCQSESLRPSTFCKKHKCPRCLQGKVKNDDIEHYNPYDKEPIIGGCAKHSCPFPGCGQLSHSELTNVCVQHVCRACPQPGMMLSTETKLCQMHDVTTTAFKNHDHANKQQCVTESFIAGATSTKPKNVKKNCPYQLRSKTKK